MKGRFFFLYLILDLFSRKIASHEVEEEESAEHAAALVKRATISEDVHAEAEKPVLHGDNGSILKATTVLAMLHWQGIDPSYSRPRVSNDNAFAEALFRTAKYRPQFPREDFEDLDHARRWAACFVAWYNTEHRHSGLRYVTPEERHQGRDSAILEKRAAVYQAAKARNPRRWSGKTRNWTPIGAVALNPERDALAATLIKTGNGHRIAA